MPIHEKTLDPSEGIRSILVGRAFHRKGVDIAIAATQTLNDLGILTHCAWSAWTGPTSETVKFMGLYSKNDPETQDQYIENYRWAHFHLFPPGLILLDYALRSGRFRSANDHQ